MNDLLELRGRLISRNVTGGGGGTLSQGEISRSDKLKKLADDLIKLKNYWSNVTIADKILIGVFYKRIIPKTKRISKLFNGTMDDANNCIKGVFYDEKTRKHTIVYEVFRQDIEKAITNIELLADIIEKYFDGFIDATKMESIVNEKVDPEVFKKLARTKLQRLVIDTVNIDKFDIYINDVTKKEKSLFVTLFDLGENIDAILEKIGINRADYEHFKDNTIYLNRPEVLDIIKREAPYIISMSVEDYGVDSIDKSTTVAAPANSPLEDIPEPKGDEPIIGVIDTLFDETSYFSKWVEYHDMTNPELGDASLEDYDHGTAVSSIIVDGNRLNKKWDDGCGHFRVRHFGVKRKGKANSFDIFNKIRKIVEENQDIRVWNLCIGSQSETDENIVSVEADILDDLEYRYNVIFIVSGTNQDEERQVRIGAPADSLNSLIVNSVTTNGQKASYARRGKVLSFFVKPDICAFGGDGDEYVLTYTPMHRKIYKQGTSFAAPWISRKIGFLVEKMHLSREIAKSIIIDSAVGWRTEEDPEYKGRGIVPTKIEDVINSKPDQIKFFIEGIASAQKTYTYDLPVPVVDGKFPFYAKAVMSYFPSCTRSQGVDYTDTELELSFGRIQNKKIKPIRNERQQVDAGDAVYEEEARRQLQKWENTKIIKEVIKTNRIPRVDKDRLGLWGISITNIGRCKRDEDVKFGIVVTLMEMNGKNRIDQFKMQCRARGWIVNEININETIKLFEKAEAQIELER